MKSSAQGYAEFLNRRGAILEEMSKSIDNDSLMATAYAFQVACLALTVIRHFALIRQLDEATRGKFSVHCLPLGRKIVTLLRFCAGVTKIADELTESFVQAEKKRKRGGKGAKGRGGKGAESKLRKRVRVECPSGGCSSFVQFVCSRSNTRSTPAYKLPTKRLRFRSKVTTSLIIM